VGITSTALEIDPTTNTPTALAIGCPLGGATVVVGPNAGQPNLAVTLNGVAQTLPAVTFSHVFVFGQTGKDTVTVSGAVPAMLIGGSGTNVFAAANSTVSNVLVGGGLNAYFLNAQTVAHDLAVNQLFGGTGPDWFWFSESAKSSDLVHGFTNGEVLTLLGNP
jgi:hypothetical protein